MIWRYYFDRSLQKLNDRVHFHDILDWKRLSSLPIRNEGIWTHLGFSELPGLGLVSFQANANDLFYQAHANICHEAYTIWKTMDFPATPSRGMMFNWNSDLVYCAILSNVCFYVSSHRFIRNLAISLESYPTSNSRSLRKLPLLRRLYLVVTPLDSIITDLPRDEYGFVELESLRKELLANPTRLPPSSGHLQLFPLPIICLKNIIVKIVVDVDYRRVFEDPQYKYRRLTIGTRLG